VSKALFNSNDRRRLYKEAREYLALRAKRKLFVQSEKSERQQSTIMSAGD
jgi:hypothetical protein